MVRVAPGPGMSRLGPNIIGIGTAPGAAGAIPGGGMTLDALMARQKQLAGQQIPLPEMQSPMQGVGYVAQQVMQGLNQGRADRQLAEGRNAMAQAMAHIDPNTGELPAADMATVAALDPEAFMGFIKDRISANREAAKATQQHKWDVETETQREKAAADLAAQQQGATGEQNRLQREAEAANQRARDAAADGRQEDAQRHLEDQAKLEAQLAAQKTKDEAAIKAAEPQTDVAKIEADFKAGRLSQQERDDAIAKATHIAPTETYSDVITGDAASKKGLDPTKQWQQNRTSGKWEIAGGSGISLNLPPAEIAARIALGDEFQKGVPQLLEDIKAGKATGLFDQGLGKLGWGRSGQIQRQVMSGVDALVRHLTGAGKSQQEAEEYASRYMPVITDTADTLADKITRLSTELDAIKAGVMQGRSGGAPAPATSGSSDIDKIVERNR